MHVVNCNIQVVDIKKSQKNGKNRRIGILGFLDSRILGFLLVGFPEDSTVVVPTTVVSG